MTERTLLKLLLEGCFLMQRKNFKRKGDYCLYKGKGNPHQYIKPKLLNSIRHLLKTNNGVLTLDLREVRKLHGNSLLKKEYKKRTRVWTFCH
jgi:hypothetical protein